MHIKRKVGVHFPFLIRWSVESRAAFGLILPLKISERPNKLEEE